MGISMVTSFFMVGGFNPLKNMSQLGSLFPIYGKIKKCWKTTNQFFMDGTRWGPCPRNR
jgi:hypothetical protein